MGWLGGVVSIGRRTCDQQVASTGLCGRDVFTCVGC